MRNSSVPALGPTPSSSYNVAIHPSTYIRAGGWRWVESLAVTDVSAEIEATASARRDQPGYPALYLDRVRAASQRLAAVEVPADDMRGALALFEQQVHIDPVVPVTAARRAVGIIKQVLRKLMLWHIRYVADQVTVAGQAAARFGTAVVERVERLEASAGEERRGYDEQLAGIDARLRRLEERRPS